MINSDQMKFLVFSPYYPPHTGGLESHSEEFNKELVRLGNEVTVFTSALPKGSPEEETVDSIRVIRYDAFEIVPNYPLPIFWKLRFWHQLFSLKSKASPEVVITRTRFFFLSFIGLLFGKKHGLPVAHIEHGSDFVSLSNSFSTFIAYCYDQLLGRIIFHFSTINISISHAVRNFVKRFDSRFSPVIYRGLNFQGINQVKKMDFSEEYPQKIILVTAARLYKWKGIENTITAIKNLPHEVKLKIVFLVVGNGEDFSRLKKLAADEPIVMLGKKSREETLAILKGADIYIHSSLPGGGLSTSLLEAMYCHCAVIATPHEGADEVIISSKNGILVEDHFSEDLVAILQKLVTNTTLRKELAEKASLTIEEKFSWKKSILEYEKILETLCCKK